MANADIGLILCPCCEFPGAHVRETVKKRAYIVCDECSSQTFARGAVSDASIRRRMIASAATPPAPSPAPSPAPAKKPETKNEDLKSWLNL